MNKYVCKLSRYISNLIYLDNKDNNKINDIALNIIICLQNYCPYSLILFFGFNNFCRFLRNAWNASLNLLLFFNNQQQFYVIKYYGLG